MVLDFDVDWRDVQLVTSRYAGEVSYGATNSGSLNVTIHPSVLAFLRSENFTLCLESSASSRGSPRTDKRSRYSIDINAKTRLQIAPADRCRRANRDRGPQSGTVQTQTCPSLGIEASDWRGGQDAAARYWGASAISTRDISSWRIRFGPAGTQFLQHAGSDHLYLTQHFAGNLRLAFLKTSGANEKRGT